MLVLETDNADIQAAAAHGGTCAVAAACQRDLQAVAANWGALFPPQPFDAALFGAVSHANAFSAPSLGADRLRVANRASLWSFGVDWQIDYLAQSRAEIDDLVRRSVAVAAGGAPGEGDASGQFLASIRDDLAGIEAFAVLRPMWCEELDRMLNGMAVEWEWREAAKRGAELPALDNYVDNADNLGSSFVDLSHWIFTRDDCSAEDISDVTEACRATQKVLRLVNDLGTHDRDIAWGDLNALMLGVSKQDVVARIAVLTRHCQDLTAALRDRQPALATFLERQIGFCIGFYGIADYWGKL